MKVGSAVELFFDLLNSEFRRGWLVGYWRGPTRIHELMMKLLTLLLLDKTLTGLEKIILQLADR